MNVIVVLVDTLRADHLHYHGYSRETSPCIDRMAAESQTFMRHYSTASRTGPAVASIFTGLYPHSHGVINPLTHFDAKGTLAKDKTTVAEILHDNGYDCFGYFANPNVAHRFGFAQGFTRYENCERMNAGEINEQAFKLLSRDRNRPFLLYLHYMEPHAPYLAPAPYRKLYVDREYDGPITGSHLQLEDILRGKLTMRPEDVACLSALYDQEIRYFDDEFSKLVDFLKSRQLMRKTIIVFIADHGEELMDHGSVVHGYTLYEEQIHVPFFIRDPRRKQPTRIDTVTRHIDFLPTILELLDISYGADLQGRSLVPLLNGKALEPAAPPEVLAEASLMATKTVRARSFIADGWKLIETTVPEERTELYCLTNDPAEQVDLAGTRGDVAARLGSRLRTLISSLPAAKASVIQLRDDEIEKLRSLGYVK